MSSDFTCSTCNALVDPGSEFWNLNLSREVEEPPHVLWAQALACNWDNCGKTFEFATYPTPSCCSSCDVEFKGGRTKRSVKRKALQSLISKQLEDLLPPSGIRYQMLSDFLGVFVSGFVLAACMSAPSLVFCISSLRLYTAQAGSRDCSKQTPGKR